MAENGGRGGRRFESGLTRADVLLGLVQIAETQTEETLQELHEREIFWADKDGEEQGFESDVVGIVKSRSKNCRGKASWSNIFTHGGKKMEEYLPYHGYESAPVNVPQWHRREFSESLVDEHEDEIVVRPPHELVAHCNNNNISFSVVEGHGRTLKGRDLRKVRDAVLRQTGFLD